MAHTTVKIPEKFATICTSVRDAKPNALNDLADYEGLDRQKTAVLAEVDYFTGKFEEALEHDKTLCGFWDEWNYSNIREEHISAMAFAAKALHRENEVADFFNKAADAIGRDAELRPHIRQAQQVFYQNRIAYLETGVVPHFTEQETYVQPATSLTLDELKAGLEATFKSKKKHVDFDSKDGRKALFDACFEKGDLKDALAVYESIADTELTTRDHISALAGYNHLVDHERGFEVVLRIARQRLWYVASPTQVRPMELFTHPAAFRYLDDPVKLELITRASTCSPS